MSSDYVDDDEVLYRRVLTEHITLSEGAHRITSQAFTDRFRQPSVDRAKLCDNDPKRIQQSPAFGVISVRARQVREITLRSRDEAGNEVQVRPFDVKCDPIRDHPDLPDNPAHAVIYATRPEFDSRSGFEKLLKALKNLAKIELLPGDAA